jgi:hypothetical protein
LNLKGLTTLLPQGVSGSLSKFTSLSLVYLSAKGLPASGRRMNLWQAGKSHALAVVKRRAPSFCFENTGDMVLSRTVCCRITSSVGQWCEFGFAKELQWW